MARNKAPLPNQKIHWQSVPGSVGGSLGAAIEVANKGGDPVLPADEGQLRREAHHLLL